MLSGVIYICYWTSRWNDWLEIMSRTQKVQGSDLGPVIGYPGCVLVFTAVPEDRRHDSASDQSVYSTFHTLNFYTIQGDSRLNVWTSGVYSCNVYGIRHSFQLRILFEPTGYILPLSCLIQHSRYCVFCYHDLNVHSMKFKYSTKTVAFH
jgi:hypothetical protein